MTPNFPDTWRYSIGLPQTSGKIINRDGLIIDRQCYSGYNQPGGPQGKNNADMQHVELIGPIPVGLWWMVGVEQHTETGEDTIVLQADPATDHKGRGGSTFRIHGEKKYAPPGNASRGCIVACDPTRRVMIASFEKLPQGDEGRKLLVQL